MASIPGPPGTQEPAQETAIENPLTKERRAHVFSAMRSNEASAISEELLGLMEDGILDAEVGFEAASFCDDGRDVHGGIPLLVVARAYTSLSNPQIHLTSTVYDVVVDTLKGYYSHTW